jgi:hypothetical protein
MRKQPRVRNICAPFVANRQAPKAMEPRDRAFDHPSQDTEATAVRGPTTRQYWDDALREQPIAMRL